MILCGIAEAVMSVEDIALQVKLERVWALGKRLAGGGFGQVYEAQSPDYQGLAVAKLVPKAPGAQRELLFVNLSGAQNVVPIIDSGEINDSWVLVMPRAEKSLRQRCNEVNAPIGLPESINVLSDVALALDSLGNKVVHRDIKPENILHLDRRWCLADFGISRYAEETTAPDTRKHALSPPYAALERWRGERATIATDVYSLGIIAFELLSRSRPFPGPETHDFREQHLHATPPPLNNVAATLAALVEECLYKAPEARPRPSNLQARLARIGQLPSSAGLRKLQELNRAEVARQGEIARAASQHKSEEERRVALIDAATSGLVRIADTLKSVIIQAAPSAILRPVHDGGWNIRLNQAALEFGAAMETPLRPWGTWDAAFSVVFHSAVSIRIPPDSHGYEGRSHSLWFCDAQDEGSFKWYETAFMYSPFIPKRGRQNPFALEPGEESAKALWTGVNEFQAAWPFTVLAIDDLDQFVDLWASWFADAAQGRLRNPASMPERAAEGSWRRK